MIDAHCTPCKVWGIKPVLGKFGEFNINAYPLFITLALIVGLSTYYILAREERQVSEKSFYLLLAGLFGGILGAKIPIWLIHLPELLHRQITVIELLSGRTITGGLLGGTLTVMYIKRRLHITDRKGNLFAPAIALGVAVGRIGCFLRGCCFGTPTNLPWGVDFGDQVLRHPTQLYEILFMLGIFFYLLHRRKTALPGELFYILMNSYFIFRFFEEFIRENQHYLGLSLFQYIAIIAIIFINVKQHITVKKNSQP